ncbi:MAG: hypothetical protein M3409_03755 [Gemmatimonadota bacterium]|jgi:hypothetical protein|nr:hypothetical protein [Gemmatimonadota bacterium]
MGLRWQLAVALGGLLAVAPHVQGQPPVASVEGSIGAYLALLQPPLQAAGVRSLAFGTLLPGAPITPVLPASASAGEWRISGMKNRRSIDISLVLPAQLSSAEGATLPLSFDGDYAALCEIDAAGRCDQPSWVAWNPVATPTFGDKPYRARPGRPRYQYDEFSVYIGGEALPAVAQRAGVYTGTVGVTLTVN